MSLCTFTRSLGSKSSGSRFSSSSIALLNLDPVLEQLREEITHADFIPGLIQELLLDNPHQVRLTMRPDVDLNQRKEAAEAAQLVRLKAAMNDAEKQAIVDQAQALEARQNVLDDESILQKVTIADVPAAILIPNGPDPEG